MLLLCCLILPEKLLASHGGAEAVQGLFSNIWERLDG